MSFIKIVLKRPMATMMIIIALAIFGISALTSIRMEYFPDLEMPMQVVVITYPGADADTVEEYVTKPLEDVGKTLTGIDSVETISYDNYCTAQFSYDYGIDLDDAYIELQRELTGLESKLPSGCQTPNILEVSLDTNATISIAAETDKEIDLLAYVKENIVPELEEINEVSEVSITGDRDKYLRIIVNEEKINNMASVFRQSQVQ